MVEGEGGSRRGEGEEEEEEDGARWLLSAKDKKDNLDNRRF